MKFSLFEDVDDEPGHTSCTGDEVELTNIASKRHKLSSVAAEG